MIVDWLESFMLRLLESYPAPPNPPHCWPEYGTDEWGVYFEDYRKAFVRNGISEQEADEARALIAEDPPRFRAEYLAKTLAAVKILREINPAAPPGATDDRDSAADASKGCKHCHGVGQRLVYASDPEEVRGATDVSAYCVCPLGRWIEGNHREKAPDVHKRTPDLARVIAGRSFWRLDPPGFEGLSENDSPAPWAAETIRRWTGAVVAETNAAKAPPPKARPDWLGHVAPAVPIPPRPVPQPQPEPEGEAAR